MFITGWTQDRGTCTRLRIWQPLTKIRRLGLADTHTLEFSDQAEIDNIIDKTDVAVIGRGAGKHWNNVISRLQQKGIKVVYDLDDNYMEIHPLSPHYKDLGIMPVNMERPTGEEFPFWVDGEKGFDLKRNRQTRKEFPETIRSVDCVTVTNEVLRKVYSRFNDKVFIIPNAIDFQNWSGPPVKYDGDNVRILYTGASNHQEDFLFIREPLEKLQQKYKNAVIVFVGADWMHLQNNLDYKRVEVHEWVDFVAYPHLIRSLACHIGIAPISEMMFNDCRSELKWQEYSALKMATVATDYGPYRRAIENGKTGLLVKEPDEWLDALSTLVENAELRETIGKNAYMEVKKNYNLDFIVEDWMKVFRTITKKET